MESKASDLETGFHVSDRVTAVHGNSQESEDLFSQQEQENYRNYVPCKYCYGYLLKKVIWKQACPLTPT